MARIRPLTHPVTVTLDGEPLLAERDEPVAAALVAAGKLTIARSPKFHRPRGPACMRGACDGCLARVDETPNMMTCLVPAREGMAIVSQNRFGPRDADLLRMTDWFFPDGMNHHELFAGVPGIQTIMQGFARRVAGLGRLPVDALLPREAVRRTVDVVVVGGGPSGMAVATRLATAGRTVELLDDHLTIGGGLRALVGEEAHSFLALRASFEEAVRTGRLIVRLRATAGAIYGRDLLVADEAGASVVEPGALVLACGGHDGALDFEGNDLPGVLSARAGGVMLGHGVALGKRVVVVVTPGGGPFGEAFARAAAPHTKVETVFGEPIAVRGTSRVKGVRVRTREGKTRDLDADIVLVDAPRSPAYELAEQAGAELAHEPRGFIVRRDSTGRVGGALSKSPPTWAAGELAGAPFEAKALVDDAERVASGVLGT